MDQNQNHYYNYYDNRVYNIYDGKEVADKCYGLVDWVYDHYSLLIILVSVLALIPVLSHLGADTLDWFLVPKVLAYLIDNHMDVVRYDVPV